MMTRAQEVLQLIESMQPERNLTEGLGRAIKAGMKLGVLGYVGWRVGKRLVGAGRAVGKPALLAWANKYGVSPDIVQRMVDSGIPIDQLLR